MSAPAIRWNYRPIQSPATIAAAPTTSIARSTTSQSGARFGLPSVVMGTSCRRMTRAPMIQLTQCTAGRRSAPLPPAAHRPDPFGCLRQHTEQRPPSARRSSGNRTSRKLAQRRSLAGQSFATRRTARATAAASEPGRGRIRGNLQGTFPREKSIAARDAAVIQRSRNFENRRFRFRFDPIGASQ